MVTLVFICQLKDRVNLQKLGNSKDDLELASSLLKYHDFWFAKNAKRSLFLISFLADRRITNNTHDLFRNFYLFLWQNLY